MQFTLKYQGTDLRPAASQKGRLEEKHKIRTCFHEQIKKLWDQDNRLCNLQREKFQAPTLKDGRFDLPRPLSPAELNPLSAFFYRHPVRNLLFIPLVTDPMEAHCHISVRLGRPMKPGSIVYGGGDLDSRLRTLFDALRMPRNESELPDDAGPIGGSNQEIFCLLSDDSLITRLSIESYQLLGNYPSDHYVDADIEVQIRAVTPMVGTVSLLF